MKHSLFENHHDAFAGRNYLVEVVPPALEQPKVRGVYVNSGIVKLDLDVLVRRTRFENLPSCQKRLKAESPRQPYSQNKPNVWLPRSPQIVATKDHHCTAQKPHQAKHRHSNSYWAPRFGRYRTLCFKSIQQISIRIHELKRKSHVQHTRSCLYSDQYALASADMLPHSPPLEEGWLRHQKMFPFLNGADGVVRKSSLVFDHASSSGEVSSVGNEKIRRHNYKHQCLVGPWSRLSN